MLTALEPMIVEYPSIFLYNGLLGSAASRCLVGSYWSTFCFRASRETLTEKNSSTWAALRDMLLGLGNPTNGQRQIDSQWYLLCYTVNTNEAEEEENGTVIRYIRVLPQSVLFLQCCC